MSVVYYVMDGDDLLISTMAARAKAKAVARTREASVCVLDEKWPLTYLQVYGPAAVEDDFDSDGRRHDEGGRDHVGSAASGGRLGRSSRRRPGRRTAW
jgi:hypothetical protein